MNFRLLALPCSPPSASPYRLVEERNGEVPWANGFLDAQRLRGLSWRSLRAYAYDLLHFLRWWSRSQPPQPLSQLTESMLVDYVRFQLDTLPQPTPTTINHRLTILRGCYRFHQGTEIPRCQSQNVVLPPPSFGYASRYRRPAAGLRLKQPRRLIVPLSSDEVARFWRSFRTCRDLSLLALMLFDGLRSHEVLSLQLEDLAWADAQIRVHGKASKERLLPLPPETLQALQRYLLSERPLTNSPALFVSLKGPRRGRPMTPAGLRSLFRHHRRRSQVLLATPHRFRHTFGSDMVRAGVSLPALMHLMGHAYLQTTLLYVQLSRQDVWREFTRAMEQRSRRSPDPAGRTEEA